MSQVKSFKLLGGEEIVAEVMSENRKNAIIGNNFDETVESYVLRRPHILQFQPMGNGQLGLAFVPWTLSNPDIERLILPSSAVLVAFDPAPRVERQYLEQTSGIDLSVPGRN